jgi:hypothetical protein
VSQYGAAPLWREVSDPGKAIRYVMTGIYHAAVVRRWMDPEKAEAQAQAVLDSPHLKWDEGPPRYATLGPKLFRNSLTDYFSECAVSHWEIRDTLKGDPEELFRALELFEQLSPAYSVRPVVYRGRPAAYNRALVFEAAPTTGDLVGIHEDLSNVRAYARLEGEVGGRGLFEISSTQMVLAHNLYLRNIPGQGTLVMYGKQFTDLEKKSMDPGIYEDGYPYIEDLFEGRERSIIEVGAGDYLVFRADYPHKVANTKKIKSDDYRVSWNGFFTTVGSNLVYWT